MPQRLRVLCVLPEAMGLISAPTWELTTSILPVPGDLTIAPMGTRHAHATQTHIWQNTYVYSFLKEQIFMIKRKNSTFQLY